MSRSFVPSLRRLSSLLIGLSAMLLLSSPAAAMAPLASMAGGEHWDPPIYAAIPFVLMLLCIAVIPLVNHHWWENDKHRLIISLLLGVPTLVFVYFDSHGWGHMLHEGQEYVSFISLLGSLFLISGGIVITGNLKGTPLVNTSFLAVGGLLASFIGTTGAAMVLIRAVLRTNSERHHKLHTAIFFIFIVCNCGGCLTPLGDPPLFLGYLRGVPFTWTFGLWPGWLLVCGALLLVYFVIDSIQYKRETPQDLKLDAEHDRPIVVRGAHNFLFLGGVVFSVAASDLFSFPSREGFMLLMGLLAWFTTRKQNRIDNGFNFGPIIEVAVVFLGIFSTMIPALALLNQHGAEFGLTMPMEFFWVTGGLSSFLDNAPTYVAFIEMADGISQWPEHLTHHALAFGPGHTALEGEFAELVAKYPGANQYVVPTEIMRAISYGAVFLGAMTYIGNGPNFMVRAIVEESGIKMPSFMGYMGWSLLFLTPVFFLVSLFLLT
ncbi:MAG: sodium:proton antiporter [Planctomycetota bacterium]|nr:MAG: sodium:proton antiporter [Planctomycetota bacterium]